MFASLLIANRGEIACRIIRTARRLGLRTVAVYSAADRHALHVEMADEAFEIGPAPAALSYLRGERIIEAATAANAQAIHPGYGFLAENADFAEACAAAGLVFVGPPPAAIRAMGMKDEAKGLMEKAGVPVVPGYYGPRQEPDFLREKAYEIGYPVLIKAVAGGGGKGMRRVDRQLDFDDALSGTRREAEAAFGNGRVLIEKLIPRPRHIEFQVFADSHGNTVHLFERDCSLQRRHQKVIEESPAPGMTDDVRAAMGQAAVAAARAVGYVSAGTVEFIADASRGLVADDFFFMEMNTRLQVEHPVTEAVTGLDLVEWQLRVAAGEALPLGQDDISLSGHAVEARVYAEDPDRDFLPSTGRVEIFDLAAEDGVRIDSGVREGDEASPFYDPMLAKVIAHGASRRQALERLSHALAGSLVAGPKTNLGLLRGLVANEAFQSGQYDTGLIETRLDELLERPAGFKDAAVALGVLRLLERDREEIETRRMARSNERFSPWCASDGFQLGPPRSVAVAVTADGQACDIPVVWEAGEPAVIVPEDSGDWPELDARIVESASGVLVVADGWQIAVSRRGHAADEPDADDGDIAVRAPMHGRLVSLRVAEGDVVEKGSKLAVVEAMKMEHMLIAPRAGRIAGIAVAPGAQVAEGQRLLTLRAQSTSPPD